jgi:hypothetical protein
MATPSSGTITMFDINSAFARGNNLDVYRGTVWYVPNSLTTGTFPTGQIAFSDFYNKTGTNPVTPSPVGGVPYTIPGVYQFVVPLFRTSLTVQMWGGGGGGGGGGGTAGSYTDPNNPNLYGTTGSASSFEAPLRVVANGGSGGQNAGTSRDGGLHYGAGGVGGTASGGDVNTAGNSGGSGDAGAYGGGSPNGGANTANQGGASSVNGVAGNPPGGGGQGMSGDRGVKFYAIAGGGGGGAYASKTYNPSQLVAGTTIQLVVAAGGASGPTTQSLYGGAGANGKVIISWS